MKHKTANETTIFQRRWPSFDAFASDAGVEPGNAQQWRVRNYIPAKYDFAIAEAASRRRIGKFREVLIWLHERREAAKKETAQDERRTDELDAAA